MAAATIDPVLEGWLPRRIAGAVHAAPYRGTPVGPLWSAISRALTDGHADDTFHTEVPLLRGSG